MLAGFAPMRAASRATTPSPHGHAQPANGHLARKRAGQSRSPSSIGPIQMFLQLPVKQPDAILMPALAAVIDTEALAAAPALPQAYPRVCSVIPQHIEANVESRQPGAIIIEVSRDPLQCVQASIFRRHAM